MGRNKIRPDDMTKEEYNKLKQIERYASSKEVQCQNKINYYSKMYKNNTEYQSIKNDCNTTWEQKLQLSKAFHKDIKLKCKLVSQAIINA